MDSFLRCFAEVAKREVVNNILRTSCFGCIYENVDHKCLSDTPTRDTIESHLISIIPSVERRHVVALLMERGNNAILLFMEFDPFERVKSDSALRSLLISHIADEEIERERGDQKEMEDEDEGGPNEGLGDTSTVTLCSTEIECGCGHHAYCSCCNADWAYRSEPEATYCDDCNNCDTNNL